MGIRKKNVKDKLVDISDTIFFFSSIPMLITLIIDFILYNIFLFNNVGINNDIYVEPKSIIIVYIVGGCGWIIGFVIRMIASFFKNK